MKEQRILITGGFGFVGTHLVELLLDDPRNRIHVVDNLSNPAVDYNAFVNGLGVEDRLTFDLCSVEEFAGPRNEKRFFDKIYHLASVVGPLGVLPHAGRIVEQIVGDTYRMMYMARDMGARLLDVSTSEIYGGGQDGFCSENQTKIIPAAVSVRLEYSIAKLASEVALVDMTRVSELDVVIVRPFNIAGPRQKVTGGFVLPRFINQAIGNEPITVYGDGSAIRAFSHVRDVVNGIYLAMERGERGTPYNIGVLGNKTSIIDLARRVLRIVPTRSEISFVDPKKLFGPLFEEANDKYPDAERAMKELGWEPKYDIEDVIRDAYAYIRDRRCD